MNRMVAVIGVCVLALFSGASLTVADDYVEDVYYWADASTQQAQGSPVPNYNPRAKEIIFIEDSLSALHPDTVRAIIREVQP